MVLQIHSIMNSLYCGFIVSWIHCTAGSLYYEFIVMWIHYIMNLLYCGFIVLQIHGFWIRCAVNSSYYVFIVLQIHGIMNSLCCAFYSIVNSSVLWIHCMMTWVITSIQGFCNCNLVRVQMVQMLASVCPFDMYTCWLFFFSVSCHLSVTSMIIF